MATWPHGQLRTFARRARPSTVAPRARLLAGSVCARAPSSLAHARNCGANASLMSIRSTSARPRPALPSAALIAGTGPMPTATEGGWARG
eukprot:3741469-Prymnesium_polylepis.1